MDTCRECLEELEHCHATSVEHADGVTECLADEPCALAHHLHGWTVACTELLGGCRCSDTGSVDHRPDQALTAA